MEEIILQELEKAPHGMRLSLLCGRIHQPQMRVARVLEKMETENKVETCRIIKSRGKPKIYVVWKVKI